MLTRDQVEAFWQDRVSKLDGIKKDPCHYMNDWMDRYTWYTRIKALNQINCLKEANKIVDVGCGIGKYTNYLRSFTDGEIIGYDRKEFIDVANEKYAWMDSIPPVQYKVGLIPDESLQQDIKTADVVTLLTVYDFMSIEDRVELLEYCEEMRPGTHMVMIDLFMDTLPWHQNELTYKYVETWTQKVGQLMEIGFVEEQQVPVSKANMRVFHKLGKNMISYGISHCIDHLPLVVPQLMAVAFRKV